MTEFVSKAGSIFDSSAQVLVNPVNLMGVSGAGLAKAFAERFPWNETAYREWCRHGGAKPGNVIAVEEAGNGAVCIVNLPTKRHWRNRSNLVDIALGLGRLATFLTTHRRFTSIAVPMLGCGLGGLRWADVRPVVVERLSGIDGLVVEIYEVTT